MLDTIILPIPLQPQEFDRVRAYARPNGSVNFMTFVSNNKIVQRATNEKYTRNATKIERERGIYQPKVTIKRNKPDDVRQPYNQPVAEVEVAAGKITHGHSVFDVISDDLPKFASNTSDFLSDTLGIKRSPEEIVQIFPSTIHLAKNFAIKDTQAFIKTFHLLGRDRRYDQTEDQYVKEATYTKHRLMLRPTAGAVSLSFSRSSDCVMYDRFMEMISSSRKTYLTRQEQEILDHVEQHQCGVSVVHFEVRYKRKQAVERRYAQYISGKKKGFTLEEIFDETINSQIMLYEMKKIVGNGLFQLAAIGAKDDDEIFTLIRSTGMSNLKDVLATAKLADMLHKKGKLPTQDVLAKRAGFHPKTVSNLIKKYEPYLSNQKLEKVPVIKAEQQVLEQLRTYTPIRSLDQIFGNCGCIKPKVSEMSLFEGFEDLPIVNYPGKNMS